MSPAVAPDAAHDLLEYPDAPPGLRPLSNEERTALENEHTNLPQSLEECITCRGNKQFRWYADDDRTEVDVWACKCDDQYMAHRYFLQAGIGLNYQRMTWADLEIEDAHRDRVIGEFLEHSEDYVRSGAGLLITGDPATGKTLVASLIVKELLGSGMTCRMMPTAKLITAFMSSWDRGDHGQLSRAKLDREVRNVDVLLLDDLGREWRSSGAGGNDQVNRTPGEHALEEIFRHRVQNEKATFITTNKTPDELRAHYGGHLINVIDECSEVVEFSGAFERTHVRQRKTAEVRQGLTRPIFY